MRRTEKSDVKIETEGKVASLTICRPPHNYFDEALIRDLADAAHGLAQAGKVRALVLAAQGKAFCAGGKFTPDEKGGATGAPGLNTPELYRQALKLFASPLPVIAAIQGPATGGGFGVALTADFRIAAPEARFWANFVSLGIYPGFGLTATLPNLIGRQKAAELFLTAKRVKAEEALALGLVDRLAPAERLHQAAFALADEIAAQAPLAVAAVRARLRRARIAAFAAAVDEESREQARLFTTQDHQEGLRAVGERRRGRFKGC